MTLSGAGGPGASGGGGGAGGDGGPQSPTNSRAGENGQIGGTPFSNFRKIVYVLSLPLALSLLCLFGVATVVIVVGSETERANSNFRLTRSP